MAMTRTMTIEEFTALKDADGRFELIRGELREVPPMGMLHGEIGSDFHVLIGVHVRKNRLGRIYTSDTQFVLAYGDRPSIVMPDVSFVRAERLPSREEREGIAPFPPDLAVEVRSPSQTRAEVEEKIALYREANVSLLWYCEPRRRTVTVYRPGQEPFEVCEDGELDGGDVLPGFRLRVADLFAD